jgi:TPR repeat protein/ABC-type uncharacterized transport system substrate-binding protein
VRDILFALTSVLIFLVRPGLAQNQDTAASLVLACDLAAASPSDTQRPVGTAGVPNSKFDPQVAIAACGAAAAVAPNDPRIMFQLGRAYFATKAYESARVQFSRASDLGYAAAQANLGVFYSAGLGGLAKDDREALRLFRLAAERGDPFGNNNVGFFYEIGRGGLPKDDLEAARFYKLAADNGEPWGQYNLGRFYQNGRGGLTRNDRESARLYRLAADQGHEAAEVNLGFFYETGRGGLPKDDLEAARLYQRAAERANAAGQNGLGRFYLTGRGGLPQSDEEAARLYRLAADQGYPAAQVNLGFLYETGRGGLPRDDREAVRLYQRAAEQGNAVGQNNLGWFYETGRGGLPRDDLEAVRLYQRAAEQGNAAARSNLGRFYQTGRGGLPRDDREAVRLFQRAAEQGNAGGRSNLGSSYQYGRGGLTADDREAARLYKLAADQGDQWAKVSLGLFYETGRGGLPLDEAEAARLYRLAAEQGHPTAQNRLAMFYELGRGGLPKDIGEATRLYKLAVEQDRDPDAKQWASDALTRLAVSPAATSPSKLSLPLVGFLALGNGFPTSPAFHQGLAEAGFVEGKNVRFEFRASPSNEQLPALAAELINSGPSAIVATNSPVAVVAARAATTTVPIVFATNVDPVAYGFVENLNRPGGNLTGVSLLSSELIGKRLSLLTEAAPDARTIAYLTMGPNSPIYKDLRDRTVAAGRALGREIIVLEAYTTRELEPAFATLAKKGAGALLVGSFSNFIPMREKIVALAQQYKLPAMYPSAIYTHAGGLMSYAADASEADRLLGSQYVGRLLKGLKPSDLPVQQPTNFKLTLNLNAAKAIGVDIPVTLHVIADEVVD